MSALYGLYGAERGRNVGGSGCGGDFIRRKVNCSDNKFTHDSIQYRYVGMPRAFLFESILLSGCNLERIKSRQQFRTFIVRVWYDAWHACPTCSDLLARCYLSALFILCTGPNKNRRNNKWLHLYEFASIILTNNRNIYCGEQFIRKSSKFYATTNYCTNARFRKNKCARTVSHIANQLLMHVSIFWTRCVIFVNHSTQHPKWF